MHDILILDESPIKWRQLPDIPIPVDWDVKRQFKQTKCSTCLQNTTVWHLQGFMGSITGFSSFTDENLNRSHVSGRYGLIYLFVLMS